MIKHSDGGHLLINEVKEQFTSRYPFLKIEFPAVRPDLRPVSGEISDKDTESRAAAEWLEKELGLSDSMTVKQLEAAVSALLGLQVQLFRQSGKFWIEARMTRDWTLKQQNDHGRDLSAGSK